MKGLEAANAAANGHKTAVNVLLANGADIVPCGDVVLRIDYSNKRYFACGSLDKERSRRQRIRSKRADDTTTGTFERD